MLLKPVGLLFLCLFFALPAASHEAQEIIGAFGDWHVIRSEQEGTTACMMSSQPIQSQGKYTKRDDVFLTVSRRSDDKFHDTVHFIPGYTYLKGNVPTLKIDKQKAISLTAFGNGAWIKKDAGDNQAIQMMKKGGKAVIQGRSARKTLTTDTFSLKGFSKAYEAMVEACSSASNE